MWSQVICKLKTCPALFNCTLYHGTVFNRETYLSSKLYSNARSFSYKETFPKYTVTHTTQNKDSEKQRGYGFDRDSFRKKDWEKEDRKRKTTSLQWSSKSVFAAGTTKRNTEIMLRKQAASVSGMEQIQLNDTNRKRVQENIKLPERPLSVADWRELKESMDKKDRFEINVINELLDSRGDLDIAKSLLTFVVTETGTLPYALLVKYLTFCVMGGHDSEVVDVYDIMRATFPSLETGASTLFIRHFSHTERWREGLAMLEELKKVCLESSRNYGDVISGAIHRNDLITAWALYEELIERGLNPRPETWEVFFTGSQGLEKRENGEKMMPHFKHEQRLLGLLHHMRDNQIYPQKNLAAIIKTWFESLEEQKWKGRWTSVTPEGMCSCCGTQLESIQLTAEEYQMLKDKVMVDVIQGPDVFKKTTPEELERFKAFVKEKPAFDVIVDGLNVANIMRDKSKMSQTLLAVVSELVLEGLTVLVLGRKHMLHPSKSWDRAHMQLLQQKAHCFFTDNISKDDPFLLYATLHSGNHSLFLSSDLMRDHKACMPDNATKRIFFKWQRGHQLVVSSLYAVGRKVTFKGIPRYDTIVQTSEGSWHIPYDDSSDRSTHEVPQKWLCLTKGH